MKYQSHYDYLEANLEQFAKDAGAQCAENLSSLIVADGDKCYQYKRQWENGGVPFYHGTALYIISRLPPFESTIDRWKMNEWIISVYPTMKQFLPAIE